MYKKWLEYKSIPKNITRAEEYIKHSTNISMKDISDELLDNFIADFKYETDCKYSIDVINNTKFDIDNCRLKYFPLIEQLDILTKFVDNMYSYHCYIDMTKLIYIIGKIHRCKRSSSK